MIVMVRVRSLSHLVRPAAYGVACAVGLAVAAFAAMNLAALVSFVRDVASERAAAQLPKATAAAPVVPTPAQPASAPVAAAAPAAAAAPTAPVPPEPTPEDPSAAISDSLQEQSAEPCSLGLRLSAVMFDARNPLRSIATLRGARPGSSGDYALGMRVGEHVLVELSPHAARFEREGESCWLSMFGQNARSKIAVERANSRAQANAQKRKGGRPAKLVSYSPAGLSSAELSSAIATRSDGTYVVDRALIDKALAHWGGVEATTRVEKVKRGRKGLRLEGLRTNGLLEALGLRGGDVLLRGNGRRIARTADLRGALAALSRGKPVEIQLERGGRRVGLAYAAK